MLTRLVRAERHSVRPFIQVYLDWNAEHYVSPARVGLINDDARTAVHTGPKCQLPWKILHLTGSPNSYVPTTPDQRSSYGAQGVGLTSR